MPLATAPLFEDPDAPDTDNEGDDSILSVKAASISGSDEDEGETRASKRSDSTRSSHGKKRAAASPSWDSDEEHDSDGAGEVNQRPVKRQKVGNRLDDSDVREGDDAATKISDSTAFSLEMASAKYDLGAMEGGRITFLFEKISGSKL